MVIITATDSAYFTGLINLIGSVHYWSPASQVVVYDLGMTGRMLEEMKRWRKVKLVSNSFLDDYPGHCRVLHQYAWKPVAIHDAIEQYESVLWVDAGSDFRASLDPVMNRLEKDGHIFFQGQDADMTHLSVSAMYEALQLRKDDFTGRPHFAGAIQGYTRGSAAHKKILKPMYHYALDENCIAPKGSNLGNHRFDQTLLSILAYRSDLQIKPQTQWLTAARADCHPDPFEPSECIIYTARKRSVDYVHNIRCPDDSLCYRRNHIA